MDRNPVELLHQADALIATAIEATEHELRIYAAELEQSRRRRARLGALQRQIRALTERAAAQAVATSHSSQD